MSNRIEVESKFFLINARNLLNKIEEMKFEKLESLKEVDEYFTDIKSEYIKNRTCLRIRKTDDKKMELTFKGKSNVLSNLYAKKESNISLDINEYEEVVEFLYATGYYSYVKVDKNRVIYTKEGNNLTYNIMLDEVKNVGYFVEFEILGKQDRSIDLLKNELNMLVEQFKECNLEVADLPYRDFVARNIYQNLLEDKIDALLLDLDGTLINSEIKFFESFRDVIYSNFNYEISVVEYEENELIKSANLIPYLKSKNIIHSNIDESKIMEDVYQIYNCYFEKIIYEKETLINFELLKKLKKIGIKLALVTTSKKQFVEKLLNNIGGSGLFDSIVCREDVEKLKPNSQAYELTLNNINIDRKNCLVIEDSQRGINAALNCGLNVLAVDEYSLLKSKNNFGVNNLERFSRLALIMLNNKK